MAEVETILAAIRAEPDANRKNLRVAALVSDCFRRAGVDPVIVGGSAVEFYTDGQYASGDVDICFTGPRVPTPRQREEIMAPLGKSHGIRRWEVAGVLVDVFGAVETTARTRFQEIGPVKLIQVEDLLAERILVAVYPQYSAEREAVARTLLAAILSGRIDVDAAEMQRVAESPDYGIMDELRRLTAEVQ